MFDGDFPLRPAAHRKIPSYREPSWPQCRDQVVGDLIHDRLVENALVAERKEIELQTFHLDAELIRDVGNNDRRKIGLTSDGADAGEFGECEFDGVVASG